VTELDALRHELANCLNPVSISVSHLDKLIADGKQEEALRVLREMVVPALERARSVLAGKAEQGAGKRDSKGYI
jgi:hypothetical protein